MTKTWLYPLNPRSGYSLQSGKKTWPTSPQGFADMIRDGAGDDEWGVFANRKQVRARHRVVVYSSKTSGRPPLLIGTGSIVKITEKDEPPWRMHIRWDRALSLKLAEEPVDATHLLRRLPATKSSVMALDPALTRWVESRLGMAKRRPARPPRQVTGKTIIEAPDDDDRKQAYARRVRAGQSEFRKNLLALYGNRCAILGKGPAAVLEAAHLRAHATTGVNDSSNGLPLRADLHLLLDLGLLAIDPDTRKIRIHTSLRGTEYWRLRGKRLLPRLDGGGPARSSLAATRLRPSS